MKSNASAFILNVLFIAMLLLRVPMSHAQKLAAPEDDTGASAQIAAEEAELGSPESQTVSGPQPAAMPTDEQRRIEMDIDTSTLSELAAWCRRLGLSEGGDANSLRDSLRNYYSISLPSGESGQESKRKIITIESARSTEYFKIEAVDEEYARLTGDVKVRLLDGDTVHEISAWDILFNRTRNIITARGGVEYKKTDSEKVETFLGDSITVNIDNWESIFLGGTSKHSLSSDNTTTYLFSGTVISRDDEDVTILTKGSIRGADNEESLWSLSASRIWLLPGSDFAILNAVLKVGEIPMLYIPFFYFPADEVVFHPVIGYRDKHGNFIQTTTYLLGRRKSSSTTESSLTRILGNSTDMEKRREGLFLRSTGKKAQDTDSTNLKVMLDYYSNLGGFAGMDLLTPKFGILNQVEFSAGFGFSRTLEQDADGNWTPFATNNYDGTSDWHKSNFFGIPKAPFRYRFKIRSGISGGLGSFTWDIPYYSDPYMESDFLEKRAEDMDWINMIQKGASLESEETSGSSVSSYTWNFSGQFSPKFPDMSPYISSIQINGFSSSLGFTNKTTSSDTSLYNPTLNFYFPSSATLYSVGGSISGRPLSLGGQNKGIINPRTPDQQESGIADIFAGIGTPLSPWEGEKNESEQVKKDSDTLVPPPLSQRFDIRGGGNTEFSFSYSFAPSSTSELHFDKSKWDDYTDINLGDIESILTSVTGNANTTLELRHSANMYSGSFTFGGSGSWRQYSYINEEAEIFAADPDSVATAKKREYEQNTYFTTSWGLTAKLMPFYLSNIWKNSNLSYSLAGLAVKSGKFNEELYEQEGILKKEIDYGEWNKDKITTHRLDAQISANVMDKVQSFTLNADLPILKEDLLRSANAALALRIWITETTASVRFRHIEVADKDEEEWKLDPLTLTERITFGTFGSLSFSMVLDNEEKEFAPIKPYSINATLSMPKIGFSAGYTANKTAGYTLRSTGWVASTEEPSLKSKDFNLSYSKTFSQSNLFNNKLSLSFGFNSRLFFDLQRYTSSSFSLGLNFRITVTRFLDFSMSFNTANSVIYRYYRALLPDLPEAIRDAEGEQYNIFTDLLNSFRFDDDERRRSSGFKIQNFNLSAIHYLGDWDAEFRLSMSPYRPVGERKYELNTDFSFLVKWKPISEIKTDMRYNKRDDRWIVE